MLIHCLYLIVSFLLVVEAATTSFAQTKPRFERLSLEHGLPQSSGNAILQDRKGFLWVGTQDGLARYDGYNFTVFRKHPHRLHTLRGDWVQTLYEDNNGILWIGTLDGGLQEFNPVTQHFRAHPYKLPENTHATVAVRAIYDDTDSHSLWVGTNGSGIIVFDKQTQKFSQTYRADTTIHSLPGNGIRDFHRDRRGTLWIATNGGLCAFDNKTKTFTYFCQNNEKSKKTASLNLNTFCEIAPDTLLLGTMNGQVLSFDCARQTYIPFSASERLMEYLGGARVADIVLDGEGRIWFATSGNGLVMLEKNGAISHHISKTYYPQSLSSNSLQCLYKDRSGIIWLGTLESGLNKFDPRAQSFTHYQHNDAIPESLSANNISVMIADHRGIIWIGTDNGLNALNPKTNTLHSYRHDAKKLGSISDNMIVALAEDSLGTLWVATRKGGLDTFNRATGRFTTLLPNNKRWKKNQIASWANFLYVDRHGMLWMQGARAAYQSIDPKTFVVSGYKHGSYLGRRVPRSFLHGMANEWWIGSFGEGLIRFDSTTRSYERFMNDTANAKSIIANIVDVLFYDSRSWLWVGTDQGIDIFDYPSKTFLHIREKGNANIGMINAILEDNRGRIWFSDNHGLAMITILNPAVSDVRQVQYTIQRYDIGDGLLSNEFNHRAASKGLDGRLYFGGVNGVCSFHPDSIARNTNVPSIVFTEYKSSNVARIFDTSASEAKTLHLNSLENSFTISFAALDFANPQKNSYAYKLEGFDSDWVYTTAQERIARYTNLEGGTYIFHVKASNNHGVWNTRGAQLVVIVEPPFWRTGWFYGIVVIVFGVSVWAVYRWKLQAALQRSQELELVREIQSNIIRKKTADDFHDEFGHKLTRISYLSEVLKQSAISVGDEESSIALASQEQHLPYLEKIIETAKDLSVGLRDFLWTLNPENDSLFHIGIRLKDFGEELFDKSGIDFHVIGIAEELDSIRFSMDERRHITLLFKEAMTTLLNVGHCDLVTFVIENTNEHTSIILQSENAHFSLSQNGVHERVGEGANRNGVDNFYQRQGLFSLHERAEKAHGHLSISQINHGVRLRFSR